MGPSIAGRDHRCLLVVFSMGDLTVDLVGQVSQQTHTVLHQLERNSESLSWSRHMPHPSPRVCNLQPGHGGAELGTRNIHSSELGHTSHLKAGMNSHSAGTKIPGIYIKGLRKGSRKIQTNALSRCTRSTEGQVTPAEPCWRANIPPASCRLITEHLLVRQHPAHTPYRLSLPK